MSKKQKTFRDNRETFLIFRVRICINRDATFTLFIVHFQNTGFNLIRTCSLRRLSISVIVYFQREIAPPGTHIKRCF